MKYAPSELADEIGVKTETFYKSLIPAGCPHERDAAGRLWIIGTAFHEWARAQQDGRRVKEKLPDGYAWCFACKRATQMQNVTEAPTNRHLSLLKGTCADCGRAVNRAAKRSEAVT